MTRSRSLWPAWGVALAVISATGILLAIPQVDAAEKKSGSPGDSKGAPSVSLPSKGSSGGGAGGATRSLQSNPASNALPSGGGTGGGTQSAPIGPVNKGAPAGGTGTSARTTPGGSETPAAPDLNNALGNIFGKPTLPGEKGLKGGAPKPSEPGKGLAAPKDAGEGETKKALETGTIDASGVTRDVSDAQVTVEDGMALIDYNGDGVPELIVPEENYNPEAGVLEQLKGEALVTRGPYKAKRQELLAGGPAPAAAPQAPAAAAPVAGGAQPRCSTVGGYEAYMRKTGRVCSCDTADC